MQAINIGQRNAECTKPAELSPPLGDLKQQARIAVFE